VPPLQQSKKCAPVLENMTKCKNVQLRQASARGVLSSFGSLATSHLAIEVSFSCPLANRVTSKKALARPEDLEVESERYMWGSLSLKTLG
jgi:hypothetical protein